VILLITPTVATTPAGLRTAHPKAFLVLAGVPISCYIVAFGPLGTGVVARVQLGHRLRSEPDESPLGHPLQSV
jgi:hypothetical protein